MKVVILAGGFGTRLSEETDIKPKPMVEIGGKPILWHIMKSYSNYGFNDFIILLGYKGYIIKEFFSNYFLHQSDVTIDLADNSLEIHQNKSESWKVTLIETGHNTMTGGRIKRAEPHIGDSDFLLTYGDGLSDLDISRSVEFHKLHGKDITMTAVQPEGRYGALNVRDDNLITSFKEKPKGDGAWINGGFFVCKSKVFEYIDNDLSVFEQEPLMRMATDNQLVAYKHNGFWKSMDTLRDKTNLCLLWDQNCAPWKKWSD
ncbi:MAG: glucose-1-phosphate cytidylyltransferase [Candidatus Marinimicrobia bacterium]|jgi:glucose-1-phosphate cytidylyltransferase|nr:glucose-1-phosphate cytidylyltransferase [Candidatus Neomarinimicrobiota bacterium]